MSHWKATLAYDGTPYNGWQIQPNLPTIQGTLAQAIQRITGESILPQGSGRTDTGVHALAQIATFSLTVPIPAANLHRALNRALPPSIRVLSIEPVPTTFHARYNAIRKTYEYRVFPRVPYPPTIPALERICPPTLAPYVWDCPLPLDFAVLQNAADHIRGTHDFTSFAAVDPDLATRTADTETTLRMAEDAGSETTLRMAKDTAAQIALSTTEDPAADLPAPLRPAQKDRHFDRSSSQPQRELRSGETRFSTDTASQPRNPLAGSQNIRTILHSTWHRQDGLLIYRVTGTGFLHHMVRNLVGTFVEAACRRISADDIPNILAARDRSAAGTTAPARGLFLVEVEYPKPEVES